MIIAGLIDYYRRLENDPDPRKHPPPVGYAWQGIAYALRLRPDGTLADRPFDPLMEEVAANAKGTKTRLVPQSLMVPFRGNRSGQKPPPHFLWDNTGYVLGVDETTKPDLLKWKHQTFRDLHLALEDRIDTPGYQAVCTFLRQWDPADAAELPEWDEVVGKNLVFQLEGEPGFVHEHEAVKRAWLPFLEAERDTMPGASLVTGRAGRITRLHEPAIKGIRDPGGQAEKRLASFNLDAFESYGKTQSYNAPLGVDEAFQYATALNLLLTDPDRNIGLGDTTVTFWCPKASSFEEHFGPMMDNRPPAPGKRAESGRTVREQQGFWNSLRRGQAALDPTERGKPFYVLGLSPSSSRVSVRFFLTGTVGEFADRLARFLKDLEIVGEPEEPHTIRRLLLETAREPKDIPPQLAGELARAVLTGGRYPQSLLAAVVRRIRADATIHPRRAALIKACLVRLGDHAMTPALNKLHPDPAYHCGRMFSLLAFIQEQAVGGINAGVVRRNMGAAMATPGLILGRLQRAAEVGHMHKLNDSLREYVQDQMQSICIMIGDHIPPHLSLVRQGLFGLGHYQQAAQLAGVAERIKRKRLHRSESGDWFASKLEVYVADILLRHGIPFVYEPRAMLPTGRQRWPDFFIEQPQVADHVYLEVLGFRSDEYDRRWEDKLEGYRSIGITPEGGTKGKLAILDWRDRWGENPEKSPIYPGDTDVLSVLRPHLPLPD